MRSPVCVRQRSFAHFAVMITAVAGDIFTEPVWRGESICFFYRGKFYLRQCDSFQAAVKNIEFGGMVFVKRDQVSAFCDQDAVCFAAQVQVGFFCKGHLIFLMCHKAGAFVGEKISVIHFSYPYGRAGAYVALFDFVVWILIEVLGELFWDEFALDFHGCGCGYVA